MNFRMPNIFGSAQNQGQPTGQQGNNQSFQPNNNQNTQLNQNPQGMQSNNMTNPGNQQNQQSNQNQNQQNQQNQQGSGGDLGIDFSKLWQNNNVDANGNPVQQPAKKSYVPQIPAEQLDQIVGNMDFTRNVMTPELTQAIIGGGDGAVQALSQVINGALRQATKVNFNASSRIMAQSLEAAENGFFEQVPNYVKDTMTSNALTSSNPLMSDPAFAPAVDNVRSQIQKQFPKMSPDQVTAGVNKYFDNMYQKMTGVKQQQNQDPNANNNEVKLRNGAPDADWNQWMQDEMVAGIFSNDGSQNQSPNQQQQQSPNFQPNQNQFQNGNQITF